MPMRLTQACLLLLLAACGEAPPAETSAAPADPAPAAGAQDDGLTAVRPEIYATVRLDALKDDQQVELQAGEARVVAHKPDWMQIS